ncbi:uncharacterized protein [Cherax quadricarinatus]
MPRGILISNGPLLYIPFLTSESIKDHFNHAQHCHQSLPPEVEHSYLEGGKFVFQRGKSCLFTSPSEAGTVKTVKILILNGLGVPPAVFGRCEAYLTDPDPVKLQQLLRGKLHVYNDKEELVACLTISISFRSLGEDVALHTQDITQVGDHERENLPGVIPSEELTKGKMVRSMAIHKHVSPEQDKEASITKIKLCKTINHIQHPENSDIIYGTANKCRTDKEQDDRLEQSFTFDQDSNDSLSKKNRVHSECSELLALKIAEFESNLTDSSGDWKTMVTNHRREFETLQPAPILYFGHNVEAEKLWNEKMKAVGGCIVQLADSEQYSWEEPENVASQKPRSPQCRQRKTNDAKCNQTDSLVLDGSDKKTTRKISDSLLVGHFNPKVQQIKLQKPLQHPSGWLRTTPVVIPKQCSHIPYPKLNRSAFLRRAKLDPQLAHQLHAEIKYQVKQRLKYVDENFEAEFIKLRGRKLRKGQICGRFTVGCQTGETLGGYMQNDKELSQKYVFHDSTYLIHKAEYHKEMEENERDENQQIPEAVLENNLKKNNDMKNGREGVSQLNRNLTFDMTEYQLSNKNNSNEKYEDDFELSTESQSSSLSNTVETQNSLNQYAPQTEKHIYNKMTSPSLSFSVSLSEPKLESKERKPTNKIRDNKLKDFETRSGMLFNSESVVREPSHDTGLTYTVHEDLPQQKENLITATSVETDQHSSFKKTPSSQKISSNQSITSNLKPDDDTYSSQVSEASDLSVEVLQEILKGKHADFLMRNGSQISDSKKELSIAEEIDTSDSSIAISVKNSEEQQSSVASVAEKYIDSSKRHSMINVNSENLQDNRLPTSRIVADQTSMIGNSTKNIAKCSAVTLQGGEVNNNSVHQIERTISLGSPGTSDRVKTASEKSARYSESRGSSPRGLDDIDSSISDVSARIAALLLAKRVSVTRLNTDSVSSYIPSDASETLSSLSDMTGD